jgi:hypothetical protein
MPLEMAAHTELLGPQLGTGLIYLVTAGVFDSKIGGPRRIVHIDAKTGRSDHAVALCDREAFSTGRA